ncbi:hypothetical protein ACFL24_02900 [Patescibacteria group bacterium]
MLGFIVDNSIFESNLKSEVSMRDIISPVPFEILPVPPKWCGESSEAYSCLTLYLGGSRAGAEERVDTPRLQKDCEEKEGIIIRIKERLVTVPLDDTHGQSSIIFFHLEKSGKVISPFSSSVDINKVNVIKTPVVSAGEPEEEEIYTIWRFPEKSYGALIDYLEEFGFERLIDFEVLFIPEELKEIILREKGFCHSIDVYLNKNDCQRLLGFKIEEDSVNVAIKVSGDDTHPWIGPKDNLLLLKGEIGFKQIYPIVNSGP